MPKRVGAAVAKDVVGVDHVAARLGHLVGARFKDNGGVLGQDKILAALQPPRPRPRPRAQGRSPLSFLDIGCRLRTAHAARPVRRDQRAAIVPVGGVFALAENHALVHDLAERLVAGHQAGVVQHLVPEPRIKEMQHGVFGAADVQVHRHPVALQFRVHQAARIAGIDEAQVVPARARPLRHGVGLAARRPAAGRIDRVQPVSGLGQRPLRRTAGPEVLQVRERQRQFAFRQGTGNSVHEHDRKRLAPSSAGG